MRERPLARWSDLVQPPSLQAERSDTGRGATWLELFFDLAFVLVVAELALALSKDITLGGARDFVVLFCASWWAWVSYTIYANRFDTDDVVYRAGKLLATLTNHPFEVQKFEKPCALCGAEQVYLDEVILDDRGGHMFVCSDTDHCEDRRDHGHRGTMLGHDQEDIR